MNVIGKALSKPGEYFFQHIKMIILLVTNNIDHMIDRVISKPDLGSSNILCHINGGSI